LLNRFERSQCLICEPVQNNPNDDEYDCNKGQTDAQTYERRFLPAFDGGDVSILFLCIGQA
jgi:hypothetical protein